MTTITSTDKTIDPSFIFVPAGNLIMIEEGCRVQVPEFHIGKFPVTQRQYQAVMGDNPSFFTDALVQSEEIKPLEELDPLSRPVETVTWHQALEFCEKLTEILQISGYEVRLPSETMWEWAAKGATQRQGYTYAGGNDLSQVGWHDDNSNGKTHPVGQKQPNELGIYDMSGNVWECCADYWAENPNNLPKDGKPLLSERGGIPNYRPIRGGSWFNHGNFNNLDYCSSGFRMSSPTRSNGGECRGFRVVLVKCK